ncbi:hypothetical protein NE237_011801 [Protea cynaroides]|uniref:Tumor necrosis factor receptor superfamily member 21 n=1 Tax=Protea cynaroides TaxID=273540 RepID=A0A9Q0GWB6_9MAGN|nr:hypothetical protein NE237_011801 [Protea cynaroides]
MWVGGGATTTFVRYFSRKRVPNLRKINPKVPPQEASAVAHNLYQIIKEKGPLTVSNTWNHAKEAGISGLSSKTHMKIMLKWMRGRKMLKLLCNHVGSSKKFLLSTPEELQAAGQSVTLKPKLETEKPSLRKQQI